MVETDKPQSVVDNDETPKPRLSVLEETKLAIDQLKKEKEEYAQIKEQLQNLKADQLLSGTGGIRQQPEQPKHLTNHEARLKFEREVNEGQHSEFRL